MIDILASAFVCALLGGGVLCWAGVIGYQIYAIIKGIP